MQLSYWEYQQLTRPRDVIIIGAGIVGLNAAIALKEQSPSMAITVIDRASIGCAATTRNAGFACFGTVSELYNDSKKYGTEEVVRITQMRRRGLANMLERYDAQQLGYHMCGGYEVFRTRDEAESKFDHITEINELIGEQLFERKALDPRYRLHPYALFNALEGHLNTGALYRTLSQSAQVLGIEILRSSTVTQLAGSQVMVTCLDQSWSMSASQIIVATNALVSKLLPKLNVEPVRNQVLITRAFSKSILKGTYHMDAGYIYFRDVGDRLLIGGGRHHHAEEATGDFGHNETNISYLVQQLKDYVLPTEYQTLDHQELIEHTWSGILSGGDDRRPIVKRLDDYTVVAARLGGIGVAIGAEMGAQAATLLS